MKWLPLLGLALGLTAGALFPQPEPPALSAEERRERAIPACDLGDLEASLQTARADRDAKHEELAELDAALVEVIGAPTPWPQVDPTHTEAELLMTLAELLPEDMELSYTDCSEYPCIAVVRFVADERAERFAGQTELHDLIKASSLNLGSASSIMTGEGEEMQLLKVMALSDPDVEIDIERVQFRMDEAFEVMPRDWE